MKESGADWDFREKLARPLLLLSLAFIALTTTATARAQQLIVPVTDVLPNVAAESGQEEEEEFIKPARPGVANPAEIQRAGVLQLESGYDANFRATEFRTLQTAPLSLRFAASHLKGDDELTRLAP